MVDVNVKTTQEIFDETVRYLNSMDVPSFDYDTSTCLYRDTNGNRCAVGYHITDDEYKPEMDMNPDGGGYTVSNLIDNNLLPERLVQHAAILSDLQSVHDYDSDEGTFRKVEVRKRFYSNLIDIADRFGISDAVVKECFADVI